MFGFYNNKQTNKQTTDKRRRRKRAAQKASLVRSEQLLRSGNLSRLTLWWVTVNRLLKATFTPSSKILIYKKERKKNYSPFMWHRHVKYTIGRFYPSTSRCKDLQHTYTLCLRLPLPPPFHPPLSLLFSLSLSHSLYHARITSLHTHFQTQTYTKTHSHVLRHIHTLSYSHSHSRSNTYVTGHEKNALVWNTVISCWSLWFPPKNGVTPKLPSEVAQCL